MDIVQIVILALIQGAAELLPVSSSAHVITMARLMGLDAEHIGSAEFVFLLIMLHTGTMFSVIVYFWPRWKKLFATSSAGGGNKPWEQFLKMVCLATAATLVLGAGLKYGIEKVVMQKMLHMEKGRVEQLARYLPLMAGALFAAGALIIGAGLRKERKSAAPLTTSTSIWIGLIQGLCLPFRGFSRSGATISVGLFRGLSREWAEDFSFALAVALTPVVIVYEALQLLGEKAPKDPEALVRLFAPGLLGMLCSFLSGLVALVFLSAVLERGRWRYFGYYCLAAALVVLGVAWHLGDLP
jgi:undecaprenyl-diphosphatase